MPHSYAVIPNLHCTSDLSVEVEHVKGDCVSPTYVVDDTVINVHRSGVMHLDHAIVRGVNHIRAGFQTPCPALLGELHHLTVSVDHAAASSHDFRNAHLLGPAIIHLYT